MFSKIQKPWLSLITWSVQRLRWRNNYKIPMIYEYEVQPFPAVRSNRRSWDKRTQAYHEKMNDLREKIGKDKEEIIKLMLSWNYQIIFNIWMPESWSKKKKEAMNGTPHRQTPDLDNLEKCVKDSLFYKHEKYNDCEIFSTISSKRWSEKGSIQIIKF